MRRREFLRVLGGAAAAWPLAVRAQQPAMPVIGFLDPRSPDGLTERLRGFRQGLKETGYVEGENATILYRWAENQFDRLPALVDELVRLPVAVIVASGGPGVALRAKAATTTIPIVFLAAEDPVKLGLVASLARPAPISRVSISSVPSWWQSGWNSCVMLLPAATRVAVLVNPANVTNTESTLRDVRPAARTMGQQIQVLNASTSREIDAAFATLHARAA